MGWCQAARIQARVHGPTEVSVWGSGFGKDLTTMTRRGQCWDQSWSLKRMCLWQHATTMSQGRTSGGKLPQTCHMQRMCLRHGGRRDCFSDSIFWSIGWCSIVHNFRDFGEVTVAEMIVEHKRLLHRVSLSFYFTSPCSYK